MEAAVKQDKVKVIVAELTKDIKTDQDISASNLGADS